MWDDNSPEKRFEGIMSPIRMSIVIFEDVEPDVFGWGFCEMGGRGVFHQIAELLRMDGAGASSGYPICEGDPIGLTSYKLIFWKENLDLRIALRD
jgi:hypothetical protein